uniref:BZIP domain-containing protein n=1 Tax=Angiostrongylus cantonensis TaxID=6313 RepID=A0A0K0DHM1_ANGCA
MSSYSSSTTGRRRLVTKTDAEEKALDKISREAEARMRVKRETREQARQHRYSLLEKRVEVRAASVMLQGIPCQVVLVVFQEEAEVYRQDAAVSGLVNDKVVELEDRFQQAMFLYSQLDNEKSALLYEEVKLLKRTIEAMTATQNYLKAEIAQRDHLIHVSLSCLVSQSVEGARQLQLCSFSMIRTL